MIFETFWNLVKKKDFHSEILFASQGSPLAGTKDCNIPRSCKSQALQKLASKTGGLGTSPVSTRTKCIVVRYEKYIFTWQVNLLKIHSVVSMEVYHILSILFGTYISQHWKKHLQNSLYQSWYLKCFCSFHWVLAWSLEAAGRVLFLSPYSVNNGTNTVTMVLDGHRK